MKAIGTAYLAFVLLPKADAFAPLLLSTRNTAKTFMVSSTTTLPQVDTETKSVRECDSSFHSMQKEKLIVF